MLLSWENCAPVIIMSAIYALVQYFVTSWYTKTGAPAEIINVNIEELYFPCK